MEIPELASLQSMAHIGGLLLAGESILPNIDPATPANRQHASLADVTPGGWAGTEVGMQGLVSAQIPDAHLAICACCHHVIATAVCCNRKNWPLHNT